MGGAETPLHRGAPSIFRKCFPWCRSRYGPNRRSSTNGNGPRTRVISVTHPRKATESDGLGT